MLAWVQNLLTWVFGAVPPTQLQSDLYSFLMGLTGQVTAEDGSKGIYEAGRSMAVDGSVASQLRLALLLVGVPRIAILSGRPLVGHDAAVTLAAIEKSILLATSEVARASSVLRLAAPRPNGAIAMDLRWFVPHGLSDFPRAASLWTLAAVALPGVAGLLILTLAGVRIGYRQAKAGIALRTVDIARFARPGPLGVVRSRSLVGVRPPDLRRSSGAFSDGPLLNVA